MMSDIPQVNVLASLIGAHSLAELVATEYELATPVVGQFLRGSRNGIYLIIAGQKKYIARIYPASKNITESHCRFELELCNYFKKEGLPVSHTIQRRDGDYLGHIDAPEGLRYYTLSSFAEGQQSNAKDNKQAYRYGAEIARVHLISNQYNSPHERYSSDFEFLIDRPLRLIKSYLHGDREKEFHFLMDLGDQLKKKVLETFANDKTPDSWHIINGDCHYGNVHFDERNEPTLFDFDMCSYGWRVYDIASFFSYTISVGMESEIADSFLAGYQSVRPLSEAELESLSTFVLIRQLYVFGSSLRLANFSGYSWFDDEWWQQNLKRIQALQEVEQ